jgi:hypothetical protein
MWKKTRQWNDKAKEMGVRAKVFCSSQANIFDNEVPIEWLIDVLELVEATPDLDWLFLTKRIDPVKLRLLITNAAASTTIQEPLGSPMPDHNTLKSQQSAADNLMVWTIFDHPRDYPAGFIARKFVVSNGKVHPTEEALQGETLESVQKQLPPDLFCLGRSPDDDPKIVESWF